MCSIAASRRANSGKTLEEIADRHFDNVIMLLCGAGFIQGNPAKVALAHNPSHISTPFITAIIVRV